MQDRSDSENQMLGCCFQPLNMPGRIENRVYEGQDGFTVEILFFCVSKFHGEESDSETLFSLHD